MQVPVTSSVFSAQTLDQFAISDVRGIADKTPGLNFSTGPLASGVLVSMRGIGSGTNNPAIDQSVALVADGVQMTQGLAFKAATFDMAQVEVLKGPQALFFGKAAPAGVISIRTADPGDENELIVRTGYEFEAEEKLGELIVSGPATDTLGLRLAAQFSDMEGFFENESGVAAHPLFGSLGAIPVTNEDFPNQETLLLRGTSVWNPTDNFSARLKLNYSDVDTQGSGGEPQLVSCPEGTDSFMGTLAGALTGTPPLEFIGGQDCKADDKSNFSYMDPAVFAGVYNGGAPFSQMDQYFGSLELNYEMDNDLTLTSVTGYYDVEFKSLFNGSITNNIGSPFAIQGAMERDDFTQELRLTSDYAGTVNFMVGAFYQDGHTDYLSHLPANKTWNTLIPYLTRRGQTPRLLPPALALAQSQIEAETISLFGQVLWNITDALELGVGTRWTDEERSQDVLNRLPTVFGGVPVEVALDTPEISSDNWSPEISLTYTLTDELTVYGNLKQAYKSGSFDAAGDVVTRKDFSFADERVRGGELGVKSRWLDDTLAFNAASYFYEYDDLQVEQRVFDPANGVAGIRTTNAASAEIYGVDLDVSYAPPAIDGLTVFAAVNWNKAEYEEFDSAQCWKGQTAGEGCTIDTDGNGIGDAQDLAGAPLLRAPDWMANLGFDYDMPVFTDMTLRIGSNTTYSDSYSASSTNFRDAYQDSYVKTSASIGLIAAEDRWKVELIGDNLTDEYVYGNCAPAGYADSLLFGQDDTLAGTGTVAGGPGGTPEVGCFVDRGRSVWLRLTWNVL